MIKRIQQQGFTLLAALLIPCILVILIFFGYKFFTISSTEKIISNDGAKFSLDYGTSAQVTELSSNGRKLQYYETEVEEIGTKIVATVYVPTTSSVQKDVSCSYERFEAQILNKTHTVCGQKQIAFIANFENAGMWYQATVFPKDGKTAVTNEIIRALLNSIKAQ